MTSGTAEQARLAESTEDRPSAWKLIGPYLSERAWGTVREDYSADGKAWQYFPYEHAPFARLPLERRRPRRHLRSRPAHVLRASVLERPRPVPQGAHLRPLRSRGESRRGREGVLVVPRRDADRVVAAVALSLSARRVPLCTAARGERAAREAGPRVRARPTPASSSGTAIGRSTAEYAKASPRDVCLRIRVRNAGPETAELHVLPTLWFRNRWSWEVGAARPGIRADTGEQAGALAEEEELGRWRLERGLRPRRPSAAAAVLRERDQRGAALRRARADAVPEGRHQRPRRRRRCHRQPGAARHEDGVLVSPRDRAGRYASSCGCGSRATMRASRWISARASNGRSPTASARPTSTTRPCGRRTRRKTRPHVMRQAFAGMVWSQQFYHYDVAPLARRRSDRAAATRGAEDAGGTPAGATSTTTISSRCRTSGNTPGTPRGTSRSTASCSRTPTRPRRSISSCCSAASGSCTRTASSPLTSGISPTSTRRCTPGRRSRCSGSTAAPTSAFSRAPFTSS